ncbi:ester cyclase [Deinococcus yavapaiensis]|uniref:Putative ester cyclase n=1 Tax=Deinococcus yavapaiensis KR-236 TaxID=694435 RepID=A0A318S9R7_9DEIO|nr:ester cyclase family protein [Deinococcus yavapaiensis]PYE54800.1 putative ester cyclase [Deinococcus yavapaiensis KR-236]
MTTPEPTSASNITEQNKALFNRWFGRVWNSGEYAIAHEVISPRMRVHGAGGQPVEQGPDGLVGLISTWRDAFPDGRMDSTLLIAEGDLVAALLTWRGTHQAEFYGAPASGQSVVCTSIGIDRIENGIIVDGWGELDMVGMMQQMGVMPKVGPGASAHEQSAEWGSPTEVRPGEGRGDEKAVAQAFVEAFNAGNLTPVLAEDYREFNPALGARDADEANEIVAELRAAMPDLQYRHDPGLLIAEGDLVAVHGVLIGTYNGAGLWGSKPNGQYVAWTQSEILRIRDGKVAERWSCPDVLSLYQGAGVLPTAGGTS